jgi:hypothetical protein
VSLSDMLAAERVAERVVKGEQTKWAGIFWRLQVRQWSVGLQQQYMTVRGRRAGRSTTRRVVQMSSHTRAESVQGQRKRQRLRFTATDDS